jgi:hypothetical protein
LLVRGDQNRLKIVAVVLAMPLVFCQGSQAKLRIPFVQAKSTILKQKKSLGEWRLIVEHDSFSGERTCHLRSKNKKVLFVGNAVGFRFGRHKNTLDAWVKVDGAQAYRWRDDLPELSRLGVAINGASLDAPTDGVVWLPLARIEDANRVDIQLWQGKRPKQFHFRGMAGLRDIARETGCAPDTRFLP